ncbi:DUF4183 domain-containing protein [Aneurinibacillus sp. BA2021]|nr:DUF4183 domain-containing protein [Aneurinibacillus sp. BA2021]
MIGEVQPIPPTPPVPPESIVIIPEVQRYLYIPQVDIQSFEVIPASRFTNDDGETVGEFLHLGKSSYSNLYVNGMLQQTSVYSVAPDALTIDPDGSIIFAGEPIILEIIEFSVEWS